MYGPWVRIPEGSQKESEKQSESDDFLLSFYFILFLFLFLFLLFFIARAMISCSLFTSNSFSFCYLNKAQTMRSIVDAMLGLSQKTGFMKYSQRDHKKRVRSRARAMISYSLFTSFSFSFSFSFCYFL